MPMPGNRRAWKYRQGDALLEYIRQPIYDRQNVQAVATQRIKFFQAPLGAARTLVDTNMTTAGSLPSAPFNV